MPPKRPAVALGTAASSSKRAKTSSRGTRSMAKGKQKAASGSKDVPIIVDLSSEDDQLEVDEEIVPLDDSGIFMSERPPTKPRQLTPESIDTPPNGPGRKGWKADTGHLKGAWKEYRMQGYAGMWVWIKRISYGDADDSLRIQAKYEDDLGDFNELIFQAVFEGLSSYPKSYNLLLFGESTISTAAEETFERFTEINGLRVGTLIKRIMKNIQGDKSANAGERSNVLEDSETDDEDVEVGIDGMPSWPEIGRGLETAKGSELDLGAAWKDLKEHFAQAKVFGYRPGFTQLGDSWIFSLSIPFKNIPLDPNTIAMWDDGLLQAWKEDQRLTLLVKITEYPLHLDKVEYWIGFDRHYKPSFETIKVTTRHEPGGLTKLYLAESLLNYLKEFPKAIKIRTAFSLDWSNSDRLAFDHEESRRIFNGDLAPVGPSNDNSDPVGLGFERNLALCAFHWILRRFVNAQDHCLNCGLEVATRSIRPYVCSNALCEWTYLTMGFGPSMEHSIQHHPGVVDLLLTFAHAAANSTTRMALPLELNIEIPAAFGITPPKYLIDLPDPDQRRAIAYLIEQLPRVSEMKAAIDAGAKIKDLDAPPGSIGVLRWVVGSCRAYLKEAKPGEGVVNAMTQAGGYAGQYSGAPVNVAARQDIRQFTFVVGSPEQERDFKGEIEAAKQRGMSEQHPTFLVFHGSATERWHNILRTGLDFQETANGRAYGHGVYFAHDASTSLSTYSRANGIVRPNADFSVLKAVACVELVNVPNTFVSSNPFYVVNNVKQIKPFLLLVQGTGDPIEHIKTEKELFKHDPSLRQQPAFYGTPLQVAMPDKYTKDEFIDTEPDDVEDARFLPPPVRFTPSPQSRFARLQLMPPPSSTSTIASRALQKEFKSMVKAQEVGELPFYIDPDTDSLYCWTVELWEFPKSALKSDMIQFDVKSIIAEIRFPSSYPHSPPFMRILHPRCLPFAQGGGGNITAGGSICHEILTATGWNPAFTVEAVIRDIMTNMTEATPPAKLDPRLWDRPYGLFEAAEAFKRVANQHGWEIPKDFEKMAR